MTPLYHNGWDIITVDRRRDNTCPRRKCFTTLISSIFKITSNAQREKQTEISGRSLKSVRLYEDLNFSLPKFRPSSCGASGELCGMASSEKQSEMQSCLCLNCLRTTHHMQTKKNLAAMLVYRKIPNQTSFSFGQQAALSHIKKNVHC